MLHTIGDPRPLEYWVHRLFPDASIRREGKKVKIVEEIKAGGLGIQDVEISPTLKESELLIWLDGIETAVHSGACYDLLEKVGWKYPERLTL